MPTGPFTPLRATPAGLISNPSTAIHPSLNQTPSQSIRERKRHDASLFGGESDTIPVCSKVKATAVQAIQTCWGPSGCAFKGDSPKLGSAALRCDGKATGAATQHCPWGWKVYSPPLDWASRPRSLLATGSRAAPDLEAGLGRYQTGRTPAVETGCRLGRRWTTTCPCFRGRRVRQPARGSTFHETGMRGGSVGLVDAKSIV